MASDGGYGPFGCRYAYDQRFSISQIARLIVNYKNTMSIESVQSRRENFSSLLRDDLSMGFLNSLQPGAHAFIYFKGAI